MFDYSLLFMEERFSLEAINALKEKYPYAASLLIYTVLERCLKIYLMGNRNIIRLQSELDLSIKIRDNKDLSYFIRQNLDDENFIKDVLMHCPLGKLEKIYKIRNQPFSKNRNGIVHSNLYLHNQRSESYEERVKKNKKYLEQAIKDIIKASGYFKKEIINENGVLKFR